MRFEGVTLSTSRRLERDVARSPSLPAFSMGNPKTPTEPRASNRQDATYLRGRGVAGIQGPTVNPLVDSGSKRRPTARAVAARVYCNRQGVVGRPSAAARGPPENRQSPPKRGNIPRRMGDKRCVAFPAAIERRSAVGVQGSVHVEETARIRTRAAEQLLTNPSQHENCVVQISKCRRQWPPAAALRAAPRAPCLRALTAGRSRSPARG